MKCSWNEIYLGECADVKGGKRLPKGEKLVKTMNNHPYIRIRDLSQGKKVELNSDFEYVEDDVQKQIDKYIVNKNDVIISIVGTIGLVSIVGETLDNANLTENCVKLINIKGLDREYIYYYLLSPYGKEQIEKGIVGAVQPKLPIKNIKDIRIKYPKLEVQKKIVSILSLIDDKIELNTRINNNLAA